MECSEWPQRDLSEEETAVPVRVLAVFGPTNTDKIERHIFPLTKVADPTLVCTTANPDVDVTQLDVPDLGFRPLNLLLMFFLATIEGIRNEYDAVVSFSLLPHGCFALTIGRLLSVPVHLGIIGIDLDVHVRAWYGPIVKALLRQFDAVTVPGPTFRKRLHEEASVDPDRTTVLVNSIDPDVYRADRVGETQFDLIWIGRFSQEKRPLLFVETVAALAAEYPSLEAVMVGDGELATPVRNRIRRDGLEDVITLPGWVDEPREYYRQSDIFVLTSERDALPLTLLEAMATGLPVVAPPVGNVPDVLRDGQDGCLVEGGTASKFADGVRNIRTGKAGTESESRAQWIRERFSYESVARDWLAVLYILGQQRYTEETDKQELEPAVS